MLGGSKFFKTLHKNPEAGVFKLLSFDFLIYVSKTVRNIGRVATRYLSHEWLQKKVCTRYI